MCTLSWPGVELETSRRDLWSAKHIHHRLESQPGEYNTRTIYLSEPTLVTNEKVWKSDRS